MFKNVLNIYKSIVATRVLLIVEFPLEYPHKQLELYWFAFLNDF